MMDCSRKERKERKELSRAGGLSRAEARCARAEGVGLPERSEPEGPQGAARGGERRDLWFGEVPEGWEVKRLASYFSERKVKVSDKDFLPLSVTRNGIMPQLENVAKTNDGDNRKLVRKGDFVINSRSDRKGSSGVSDYDGSVSLINLVLQPRGGLYGAYCNYLLKSLSFVEENYRNGRGIVADLWTTRYDEMKMIKVAMPPLAEQKAIVAYLDAETGRIDKAIAAEEKMIALLQERREIVINEAVGGGLGDFSRKERKDRKGWEVRRLKNTTNGKVTDFMDGDWIESDVITDSGIRYLTTGNVGPGFYKEQGNGYISESTFELLHCTEVYPGDLLISRLNEPIGRTCIIPELGTRIVVAVDNVIYRPNECLLNKRFIVYLLNSQEYATYMNLIARGSTMHRISRAMLGNVKISFPSLAEQEAIVARLDEETGKIDRAIAVKRRQIELLRERRQIVIDEVVTGKVKVA